MKAIRIYLVLGTALCASGLYTSYTLLGKHMRAPGGPAWIEALCESGPAGHVSCDKVLASRWGMFPPTEAGTTKNRRQLPVALIGMAYFTTLLTWIVVVGVPNRRGRFWHVVPLLLNAAGLLASAAFIKVMAFDLATWCPLCLATHVVNVLLFVVNVLLWPRASRVDRPDTAVEAAAVARAHPSIRLALAAIVLAWVLAQLETRQTEFAVLKRQYLKMANVMKDVQQSANTLVALHLAEEPREISVGADDPVRYMADHAPTVVVWSDFACTHCRRFAENFDRIYAKHFAGFLRLVHKDYPVCSDCNPYVARRTHPAACGAAELAESVRTLAGNDAFWKVHDLLFDAQDGEEDVDVRRVAESLHLDPDKVIAAMGSEPVRQRIAQDVELAHQLGVHATPAVFLEGREVSNITREVDAFWRVIGQKVQALRDARQRAPSHGD